MPPPDCAGESRRGSRLRQGVNKGAAMASLAQRQHGGHAPLRSHRIEGVVLLLSLLVGAQSASSAHAIGTIRFAAPGGMAVGLCNSWVNACHLQYAVTQAVAGDQVWVKQGTHLPIGSRSDSFALKDGVGIYGGFLGTETLLSQRDAEAHVTILSGEIGNPVDASDNSYHVVVSGGTDATAVLDGFTITAGNGITARRPMTTGVGCTISTAAQPSAT